MRNFTNQPFCSALLLVHITLSGSDAYFSGDTDPYSFNPVLPNLSASQVISALSDWDGMENTIALFKDLLITESRTYVINYRVNTMTSVLLNM